MRTLIALAALVLLAGPVTAQDPGAVPNFGTITLEEGFTPDPNERDLTAGGIVSLDVGGCQYGNVSEAPDLDLNYETTGGSDLYIYAVSLEDTMILVNTPSGTWACDDDSYDDGDPLLVIRGAPAGLYSIWVGTYEESAAEATLFISEIDPR
jgi:hypothetical protein